MGIAERERERFVENKLKAIEDSEVHRQGVPAASGS